MVVFATALQGQAYQQLAEHQSQGHLQQAACREACLQHGPAAAASRKDYTFRRQFHDKPSLTPGCPDCAAELTKVMPGQALPLSQVLLNDSLGGDTSVVCPRQPQHLVPTHAPPPDHSVLDGIGEGMAQVQGACHVWGWDHNDKGWLVAVQLWFEEAGLLPPVVPASSTRACTKLCGIQQPHSL